MRFILMLLIGLAIVSSSASASRYGDCYNNCKSSGLPGKDWDPNTMKGACSKGCSFRQAQANDEATNRQRALDQCIAKYGTWGSKMEYCSGAVNNY